MISWARIYLLVLIGLSVAAMAATRRDFKVLEATDAIKFSSNSLAKNYLLYAKFPHKRNLIPVLKKDIKEMSESFRAISLSTKDPKTKGLLTFFAYQKARAEEILSGKKPNVKLAQEVLDMSESFDEGSREIARRHMYPLSLEEKMFSQTRSLIKNLESVVKYYVALQISKNDQEIVKKLKESIKAFDDGMSAITEYQYKDKEVLAKREIIINTWKTLRPYLSKANTDTQHIPMIASSGVEYMEDMLRQLSIYHSQNQ